MMSGFCCLWATANSAALQSGRIILPGLGGKCQLTTSAAPSLLEIGHKANPVLLSLFGTPYQARDDNELQCT